MFVSGTVYGLLSLLINWKFSRMKVSLKNVGKNICVIWSHVIILHCLYNYELVTLLWCSKFTICD